ncbi:MAG: helix-turn-helix transcriptional regulator [Oscillospiraceae bacterium]|nr:helix-turn-helix transcriptional regulator [Oscillospiraceae bacterium]
MSFGTNLKLFRKEKGITQEQLADMLEVSRQAVSKWESDNGYPETEKLLIIAKKLGVSLDYLMDNAPGGDDAAEYTEVVANPDNKFMVTVFDGSKTVSCLSVRYSKIVFPAKNEPAYILVAVDRVGFFGAHTVILGWYNDENAAKKEMAAIAEAVRRGDRLYRLRYFTDVKFSALGAASRK